MEMPNMKKAMILTVASLLAVFVFTGCDDAQARKAEKQRLEEQAELNRQMNQKLNEIDEHLKKSNQKMDKQIDDLRWKY